VPRRVRLPGADELFRTTATGTVLKPARPRPALDDEMPREDRLRAVPEPAVAPEPPERTERPVARTPRARRAPDSVDAGDDRRAAVGRPTGRQRHDEKITVYVTPEELLELERARITLRAEYGLVLDRGRIVREAIAMLLADLDANGPDSVVVRGQTEA
jgi:hypothetical protein